MTAQQSATELGTVYRDEKSGRPYRPLLWWSVLAVGFVLQVAWRLHLSLPVSLPIAHGDEDGYLLGARVLAGGPAATLPEWSIMRPMGYPLLIAPVYWFVQQPEHVYIGVHIVDALLMALNFPLLYLLGRRLFGCERVWSAAIAFVLATLPSLVFFSEFALTDALVPELLLLLLLAVHGMVSGGRRAPWYGILAGLVAGYAANTHVRGLVMLVVLIGLVVLGWWRRWLDRATALAAGGATFAVYLAGYAVNSWLQKQLFPTGAVTVDGRVVNRLTTVHGLFRVIADGSGQMWHLCTSTYGLAALGLAAAIVQIFRREGPRPTRIVLGAALAMNVGIALATAAGIPDEQRVNNHVYGRYVALFAGLWSLVAVIALARASWRRSALLVAIGSWIILASVAVVEAYAGEKMRTEHYVNFDAPELSFLSGDFDHLHIYRMTALAIGLMGLYALLLTGWRSVRAWDAGRPVARGRRAVVALGGTLVLNLVAMVAINDGTSLAWAAEQYGPGPAQLVRDAHVVPGSTIAEVAKMNWQINQRQQREVYWQPLEQFDPTRGAPPGRPTYVVATTGSGVGTDWNGKRYGYVPVLTCHETKTLTWVVWKVRA
jgi:hypothetical protein